MESRDNQFQPLGVCQKLFNFIMDSIVARGLKRITLGPPPKGYSLVEIPITSSSGEHRGMMPKRDVSTQVKDSGSEKLPSSIAASRGGCGAIIATGSIQTQLQKEIPLEEGQESKQSVRGPSKDKGVGRSQKNGSAELMPPSTATDSEARGGPKKIVSFKDEAEVSVISKGKEKKTGKEKFINVMDQPDTGGKGKVPRPLRVVSNIDEKSAAFIRSRKEIISRSGSDLD